jgi:hypothetical protein
MKLRLTGIIAIGQLSGICFGFTVGENAVLWSLLARITQY